MHLLKARICILSKQIPTFKYLWPFIFSSQPVSYLGKWETPQGHDTGITLYNSAASKKVPLLLQKKDLVTW